MVLIFIYLKLYNSIIFEGLNFRLFCLVEVCVAKFVFVPSVSVMPEVDFCIVFVDVFLIPRNDKN